MERLLGAHMDGLDVEGLTHAMHETRVIAEKRNEENDRYEEELAEKTVGIGPIIARFFAAKSDHKLPTSGLSNSRFHMWRAIFALSHADDVVTNDELKFMHNILETERLSGPQRHVLEREIHEPQDTAEMFMKIGDQEDRSQFFYFARMLCWSDGNFDEQEQKIMLKLKSIHVRNVNIDEMIEKSDLAIDDNCRRMLEDDMRQSGNIISRFIKRFVTG